MGAWWRPALSDGQEREKLSLMPLSENEARILRQIEQELERDPAFSARGHGLSPRRATLLVVGVVAGIAATVLLLAVSVWLSIVAFVATVAVGVALSDEVKLHARHRVGEFPLSVWLGGARRAHHDPDRSHPQS